MDAIKAIIVDDERAAVESLSIMLNKYCDDLNIVATAMSINAAKKEIVEHNPDVVFLDIMMPDGTGFDILEELPNRDFEIVFVTAYNHVAIKALKYCAIEFIQKPVCKDELTKAVEKVKNNKGMVRNSSLQYSVLFENLGNELPNKLCLPTASGIEVVDVDEVLAFESRNNGVVAYISDGRSILSEKSIDRLEDTLLDGKFCRITNELLLNQKKVEIISKSEIFMHGGKTFNLPIERISEFKIRFGNPPY
jgi:two-component system, LytTR family, response regulator